MVYHMIATSLDSFPKNVSVDQADLQESLYGKKPVSRAAYFYYTTLLVLLSPFSLCAKTYQKASSIFKKMDPEVAQVKKVLKEHVVKKELENDSNQELYELAEKVNGIAGIYVKEMVIDVLSLGLKANALKEVLKGANISIEGDNGAFFDKWKHFPVCIKRVSSHKSDPEGCFSVKDPIFHEFLFWKDKQQKNTRFQLERTALFSFWHFSSSVIHLEDYLVYKRSGQQQGVFGNSEFTENHPIKVTFNEEAYLKKRAILEKAFNPLLEQPQ